jgi:hypothetical protein
MLTVIASRRIGPCASCPFDPDRPLPPDAATLQLHSVALEYLLATLAQLRAILLQTLLNRVVVAQLLPAKSLCVSRARLLLLRGAHMALSQ